MKNGIRALSLILNQDFTPSPYTNEYNKASKLWFNVLPVCLTKQTQLPYWSGKQNSKMYFENNALRSQHQ